MTPAIDAPVRRFILAARVARLATADAAGAPHVVPVCYAFDGERFYFVVDDKPKAPAARPLKRLRNIRDNPRVALVIDRYSEDWTALAWVLVSGTASLVAAQREYAQALALLHERYAQYRSMPLAFERNPMVRITPGRIRAWGRLDPA